MELLERADDGEKGLIMRDASPNQAPTILPIWNCYSKFNVLSDLVIDVDIQKVIPPRQL